MSNGMASDLHKQKQELAQEHAQRKRDFEKIRDEIAILRNDNENHVRNLRKLERDLQEAKNGINEYKDEIQNVEMQYVKMCRDN